jgi:hypothetical protein
MAPTTRGSAIPLPQCQPLSPFPIVLSVLSQLSVQVNAAKTTDFQVWRARLPSRALLAGFVAA